MGALFDRLRTVPVWVWDGLIVVALLLYLHFRVYRASAADFLLSGDWYGTWALVGLVALLFRRQFPLLVFFATLPSAMAEMTQLLSLVAAFTLATRIRNRWAVAACAAMLALAYAWQDFPMVDGQLSLFVRSWEDLHVFEKLTSATAIAIAPFLLGQLLQAKRDVSRQVVQVSEAREHEQLMQTQSVLATERAQLAREMHDVVSHQVSLIAVQAGALKVRAADEDTRDSASVIRDLSVKTLDELRHMVSVLRASGSHTTEITPQPTLEELESLVDNSGMDARLLVGDLPDTDLPTQRTIYRTVQEALTNARKHAPGASAVVRLNHHDGVIHLWVINSGATRPALPLPGAEHGLMGLRQRAELIGGTLEFGPTEEHGWHLHLSVPVQPNEELS